MKSINFDCIAKRYDITRAISKETLNNIANTLKSRFYNLKYQDALEIGIGTGRFGIEFASLFSSYIGIDISEKMLMKLSEKDCHRRIKLLKMDGTTMSFVDNCFDFVFLFSVLHLIEDWKKLFLEIKRILKNDGLIVIGRKEYVGEKSHIYEFIRHKIVRKSKDIGLNFDEQILELSNEFSKQDSVIISNFIFRTKVVELLNLFKNRDFSEIWELSDIELNKKIVLVIEFLRNNKY